MLAQETTIFTEANRHFRRGNVFFDQGLFARASREYTKSLQLMQPINEPEAELLQTRAELKRAQCAIMQELPEGEQLVLDFINNYQPEPVADLALIDLANYYFNQREYEKATEYYQRLPSTSMTKNQRAEVRFREGYSYFVQKQFITARSLFEEIDDVQNDYYYPANYYLGICYFYEGEYDKAIDHLRIAEADPTYKSQIPYYLAQIYFAEGRYQELLSYAEPKLRDARTRDRKQINLLVGQAYFELGEYHKALPYLENYAAETSKMRPEELYQLGFSQYQTGNYPKAIDNLQPLTSQNSQIGQNAAYYLAVSYLKTNQKKNALAALGTAKRLDYDQQIKEDATFNYGKLAYELNQPRVAVAELQSIGPASQYYQEAQDLMSDIFLNYRDYQQALDILGKMSSTDPKLVETRQKVNLYRGLQLLQEDQPAAANEYLQQSLRYPANASARAQALYWLGDLAYREGRTDESINYLQQFLRVAPQAEALPPEASVYTANYTLGYSYLEKEDYTNALKYFDSAIRGIQDNRRFIDNEGITKQMLGDAILRAGDAHFKFNKYDAALNYYNQAVAGNFPGRDYASFQKAIIEGLQGNKSNEILALQDLIRSDPQSEYADDALLRLGTAYQEVGKFNQAAEPLQQLVNQYRGRSPMVNQGLLRLGLITYNQNNIQSAINYYKQVFQNNPTKEEATVALKALEEIYVRDLGQPAQYFAFLETVPGYKVDNAVRDSINFQAAESQFESGDYQRAIQGYTNYLRSFPNGVYALTAYYHRAESNSVLRQYSQALEDYQYVAQQGPSQYYVKALEKAAIIAYNHELDFDKAYRLYDELEEVAATESQRFEAQLGALRSAYRIDDQQAVYQLANRVEQNPNATNTDIATAEFYLGKLAYDQRNFETALRAFQKVDRLSDDEQAAEARYLMADIYYQQRELNKAQEICINANRKSSAYPYWVAKSVLLLADIFAEKGDLYNARAALEALLENYDDDREIVQSAQARLRQINQQIESQSIIDNSDNGMLDLNEGN